MSKKSSGVELFGIDTKKYQKIFCDLRPLRGVMQENDHKVHRQIALRFRELRKERNLTLDAVIFDTGINIKRIEYGGNINLSVDTIVRLCEYYEISLGDFFNSLEQ